ncbi:sugar transferase [Tissierella pigra]|uniref:Sugar transferase n=1 Tax=Tissierella pigra TaxID=2607614 RepID=A0A6N7XR69_9FIRM|nr:sugar transferase [Tissierella pigra]MSU00247.1 sugar transferase [Tissierella pigra]
MRTFNLVLKRLMDFFGSLVGVIIISPILLIIAILVKLNSRGPVLFKQERLGKDGKVFKILKFRTMVVNAENIGDGIRVKSELDNRITKIGKVLRKTSLDELPQLINVIKGEMSLVGPRPPVVYHPYNGYANYPEGSKKRFSMRPGITGLAQVAVRNSVTWDERIVVDNEYINKFNVWLDIKIILFTIIQVVNKESVYGNLNIEVSEDELNV